MADYDGNIDKVADGNKISIYGWGKNILAFTGENTDTIVIDPHSGKQIRYVIRNDDEGLGISDISRTGDIALAGVSTWDSHDNSRAIRLIDTKTGQRVDCKIKTDDYCYLGFVDNDQKIVVDYSDAEDPTKLHIDVYKSNIHYSPIEKLIFFAQDNMPIVVGGGIATVLMIIGGIAVVCIRRKKSAAQASLAPHPKQRNTSAAATRSMHSRDRSLNSLLLIRHLIHNGNRRGSPSQTFPSSRSHLLPRNSAATAAPRSCQKPSSAPSAAIRSNST